MGCGIDCRRRTPLVDRTTSSSARRRLLTTIGDAAQLAGWLSIDTRHYGEAIAYCRHAIEAAKDSDDRGLQAYALGVFSYVHLHAGRGDEALKVLDAANQLAARSVAPAVRAWLAEATGEAHAFRGDLTAGLRSLHQCEVVFDSVRKDNTPTWLAFFNDESHAARLTGRCLMRLDRLGDAEKTLHHALGLLSGEFVRERAGTLIDLAYVHVRQREIEQACRIAREAQTIARRTQSGRNLHRLRELLIALIPYAASAEVQELYHFVLLDVHHD